jgi:hypothetical protein
MKRQNLAAVSALSTGFAAGQALSEPISTQLGVAHNLQGQSEFLCFQPKRRENGEFNKARRG